ncbi:TonB-dependent receptor plug domain-containing protein [uncultured Maribacter sp.]|uniref:TonB-dependent receptor plug domain-containing protein n=1 Tax=uncultured Maribacter sp. TaxID=431308 RepID=UPI0030D8D5C0|tara:strand:+ start:222 stop:878 length:657 start_codon:yes stop_codon:yes gene_type:complete
MKSFVIVFLFLCFSFQICSQDADDKITWLTGTVLNSQQEPIKKAIIYLDSVKTKTTTDKKGRFEIGLRSNTKYISAYSQNYGIETIPFQGNTTVLLVFSKIQSNFSEEKLKELGFNNNIIKTGKKPNDYSEYLNIYQLIANEVPGATVVGSTIRLRGNAINSDYAGQDPLIIVDGAVVGSIEYIFPRDVASIRVIRDQDASIYGVRGANGVIEIKMKH